MDGRTVWYEPVGDELGLRKRRGTRAFDEAKGET
jgi:hypothetical protein